MDDICNKDEIVKYLPWSNELPEDILNYEGTESADPIVVEEQ